MADWVCQNTVQLAKTKEKTSIIIVGTNTHKQQHKLSAEAGPYNWKKNIYVEKYNASNRRLKCCFTNLLEIYVNNTALSSINLHH
jgi:hypothetical protein